MSAFHFLLSVQVIISRMTLSASPLDRQEAAPTLTLTFPQGSSVEAVLSLLPGRPPISSPEAPPSRPRGPLDQTALTPRLCLLASRRGDKGKLESCVHSKIPFCLKNWHSSKSGLACEDLNANVVIFSG